MDKAYSKKITPDDYKKLNTQDSIILRNITIEASTGYLKRMGDLKVKKCRKNKYCYYRIGTWKEYNQQNIPVSISQHNQDGLVLTYKYYHWLPDSTVMIESILDTTTLIDQVKDYDQNGNLINSYKVKITKNHNKKHPHWIRYKQL